MIDVLVAGGGPAGLATAIFAAKAGMRVIVVEPHRGPIDKACGEGIMPAGRVLLDRMGVRPAAGRPFEGIRYHQNGVTATGRFRHGDGIAVRRTDLSEALWARAVELGVERRQGRIRKVKSFRDSVCAAGIEARWLAAADGLNSSVREAIGISLRPMAPGRYGVRQHFVGEADADFVDVYLSDSDEAYVTPIADALVGVALLSSEPKRFENGLAQFPELSNRLGEPIGRVQGAGPFARFASRVSAGRVALVGDAAGFLDPITGEGICLGFRSAAWLVECLQQNRLDRYDDGWRRIVRTYRWVTSAILALRRNRYLNGAIVPTLRAVPGLFDGMLRLLGGVKQDPSPAQTRQ